MTALEKFWVVGSSAGLVSGTYYLIKDLRWIWNRWRKYAAPRPNSR